MERVLGKPAFLLLLEFMSHIAFIFRPNVHAPDMTDGSQINKLTLVFYASVLGIAIIVIES